MPDATPHLARRRGSDWVTVGALALAAFLAAFALLATQLAKRSPATGPRTREVLVRRVYRTAVIERVLPAGSGGSAATGPSVSQSTSALSPEPPAPAVTRVS